MAARAWLSEYVYGSGSCQVEVEVKRIGEHSFTITDVGCLVMGKVDEEERGGRRLARKTVHR